MEELIPKKCTNALIHARHRSSISIVDSCCCFLATAAACAKGADLDEMGPERGFGGGFGGGGGGGGKGRFGACGIGSGVRICIMAMGLFILLILFMLFITMETPII